MPIALEALNRMECDAFTDALGAVFEASSWVARGAWNARPFMDVAELHAAMVDVVTRAPVERRVALVRAHPDLAGKAAVAGDVAEASGREQRGAGLDRLTPEEFARFRSLNQRYRDRFGFPFVVAVRGHDKHTILHAFELRLGNDPDAELRRALEEIARIARFRLEELVAAEGAP
jgi:2-oxo-4-hydroxy-4-carboxy-5-ureidoimidazoline decarboxylase